MQIARVSIKNFRGVLAGQILLPAHAVLVGDNNIGKSTILEAIDLVLGPERLNRRPPIDEHDFHAGLYVDADGNPVGIESEVVIVNLSADQLRHFRDHLEWWKLDENQLISTPPPEETDAPNVVPALRVVFEGHYNKEEDDFAGATYFASPTKEDGSRDVFRTPDKRLCGFLYLRTLRTGSRALSLEKGSLLDIILKLQDKQLRMWESVLAELRVLPVAENEELGIKGILSAVQDAVREFVPAEWANNPHMRVSDLTREALRKSLTVFMGTGSRQADGVEYAAPFQHQGTGTINTLVLSLLSMIAELKSNVIFAMEEPEIAIPPHAQKRIIESVQAKSAQAIFTSHSPYVLEEFPPHQVIVLQRDGGVINAIPALSPVKPKRYKEEFRRRFCETLLARRVLIVEGKTEYDAFPAAAKRLRDLHPNEFRSLDSLGIAVINAETDSQIAILGNYFRALGKTVFAIYDHQVEPQRSQIEAAIDHRYEGPGHGFETTLLQGVASNVLLRFAEDLLQSHEWPSHIAPPITRAVPPVLIPQMLPYLKWAKGTGAAADLLMGCTRDEMPRYVVDTLAAINAICEPPPLQPAAEVVRPLAL